MRLEMRAMRLATLAVLLVGITPCVGSAQTAGTFQWYGIGNSFISSFRYSDDADHVITAYAGGAYQAQFNIPSADPYLPPHETQTGFGPAVDIFCIDFLHDANSDAPYSAFFTNLGNNPLTKTRSTDITKYLKAAYLVDKMDKITTSQADRVDLHAAIWNIMAGEPYAAKVGWADEAFDVDAHQRMLDWVSQAETNYGSVNKYSWTVVTDACIGDNAGAGSGAVDGCSQEFLTRNPVVTPEPGTVILMATGMLMMAGLAYTKRGSVSGQSLAYAFRSLLG
jgi:hypothetical protein